eukprot:scaffold3981_cov302-Prasinococcus_capsulatus_cf.AAC.2
MLRSSSSASDIRSKPATTSSAISSTSSPAATRPDASGAGGRHTLADAQGASEQRTALPLLADHGTELLGGLGLEVLAVHPAELDVVEDGGALGDAIQGEALDELVDGEDLLLRAVVPSEQRKEVEHGLVHVAQVVELPHRGGAVALGQLAAVGREDERDVRKLRALEAQGVVEESLAEGVGEVLLGADDVADAHERVIDGHAEVVHGHAVAAQDDEITQRVGLPRHLASDVVVDLHRLVLGHAEAVREGCALLHLGRHLLWRRGGPLAAVDGRDLELLRLLLHRGELLVCAEARVRHVLLHQVVHVLAVDRAALRLPVRAVGALLVGALVVVQAEPRQIAQHGLLRLASGARCVGILHAEDELAAQLACVQPVEQRCSRAAHVQIARGGRREARPHLLELGILGHALVEHRAVGGDCRTAHSSGAPPVLRAAAEPTGGLSVQFRNGGEAKVVGRAHERGAGLEARPSVADVGTGAAARAQRRAKRARAGGEKGRRGRHRCYCYWCSGPEEADGVRAGPLGRVGSPGPPRRASTDPLRAPRALVAPWPRAQLQRGR